MSLATELASPETHTDYSLRKLSGHIGAQISGVTLSADLSPELFQRLYRELLTHKVLFFRGQHHLDDAGHEGFARLFGELVPHPTQPALKQSQSILELDASKGGGRADSWHTDVTFVPDYPKIAVLRGIVIPEYGGDTVWANTATAYAGLPDNLKAFADQSWAIHSNEYDYAANRQEVSKDQLRHYEEVFLSKRFETAHPLVHVHPETGERNLLLGHFLKRIIGLRTAESRQLFDVLQSRTNRLENTVRWSWQQGDIAIWDNRATQHYAVNDYGRQPRVVRRVTVAGEPAYALNGRRSHAYTGETPAH